MPFGLSYYKMLLALTEGALARENLGPIFFGPCGLKSLFFVSNTVYFHATDMGDTIDFLLAAQYQNL